MKDIELTYSPYILKLKKPFSTSKKKIKERKGFILKINDPAGFEGIGDACPFPEFGSESYSDIEKSLLKFKLNIKIDENNLTDSIKECLSEFERLPALRHGLEQAIINMLCNKNKTTIDKLLTIKLKKKINVNSAIGMLKPDESVSAATKFIEQGYNTIKLKIRRKNFDDDFNEIQAVRNVVGENVKLRIDSNGKWNLNEATKNLREIEKFNIEYAEQPVNEFDDYIELRKRTKIPLAPDESIRTEKEAEDYIDSGAVSYIILKPMMLGGLTTTLNIIRKAEAKKIIPVITSSFESAVGRTNIVIAAAATHSDVAHGVGITNYFKNDLINDPYPIISGTIILN